MNELVWVEGALALTSFYHILITNVKGKLIYTDEAAKHKTYFLYILSELFFGHFHLSIPSSNITKVFEVHNKSNAYHALALYVSVLVSYTD